MIEQFVLQEIMELNTDMSSMNINGEDPIVITEVDDISGQKDAATLKEVDENGKFKPRRSLRKRIRPLDKNDLVNGSNKIQKLNNDVSEVEKYYLSKKVKRLPSTLETIFEEPKQHNNKQQYVSVQKFKRSIKFEEDIARASRLKVRKRKLKAKKLASSKGFLNRKKVSMDTLLTKLSAVESDKE